MNILRLSVTSRVFHSVIDLQVVDVVDELWIGDLNQADVVFPGAVLRVLPGAGGVQIFGTDKPITLLVGGNLVIDLSDRIEGFEIELAVVERRQLAREQWFSGDIRLLVLTGAIVLMGMWADTLDRWAHTNPQVVSEIKALPALWSRHETIDPSIEPPPPRQAPRARYRD